MTAYAFGIEEEYFVVDRRTGYVKTELSEQFMQAAGRKLGRHLMNELLQSQIEVATEPLVSAIDARQQLLFFRRALADSGRAQGLGIVAAGTHPLARAQQHRTTNKRRYAKVTEELGIVGQASAVCALHVHVELPDPDQRVGIMHRMVPFLPILLALSTSSPFWDRTQTGLLGYRNAANNAFPRSGLPEMFRSLSEYQSYVRTLIDARIIPDASYIWWALRPALRHPTLELRVPDCCTSINDAVAIAGLYRALVRHLVHHPEINAEYSALVRALTEENFWRAQRYGTEGTYINVRTHKAKPFSEVLDETIAILENDFVALGLLTEPRHLRKIVRDGTSAHRQLRYFQALRRAGKTRKEALQAVARWLCRSTEIGDFVPTSLAANERSSSARLCPPAASFPGSPSRRPLQRRRSQ
jgi:glutamate---cysteine ligase / carboxylate-amine ligase